MFQEFRNGEDLLFRYCGADICLDLWVSYLIKNKTDNKMILVSAVRLHLLHEYMNNIHLYQHH